MKKLIALLLAVVMVMGLAACGSKTTTETKAPTEAKVDTPATEAKKRLAKKPVLKFLKRPTSAKHRLAMMQQQNLLTKDAMSSSRTASAMSLI